MIVPALAGALEVVCEGDDTLKGFGVCVTPRSRRNPEGRKTYIVQYRVRGSRRSRRLALGLTAVLGPHQAHARAIAALGEAASGKDPFPAREADYGPQLTSGKPTNLASSSSQSLRDAQDKLFQNVRRFTRSNSGFSSKHC